MGHAIGNKNESSCYVNSVTNILKLEPLVQLNIYGVLTKNNISSKSKKNEPNLHLN